MCGSCVGEFAGGCWSVLHSLLPSTILHCTEQASSSPMCRRCSAEGTRSLGKHGQFAMAGFSQPARGGARRAGEAGFRLFRIGLKLLGVQDYEQFLRPFQLLDGFSFWRFSFDGFLWIVLGL